MKSKKATKKSVSKKAPVSESKISPQTAASAAEGDTEESEDEDFAPATAAGAAGGDSSALAARAAAMPGTEGSSPSLKNFRHHPDMENFYRFIFENDLRFEALGIIDQILTEKINRKALKVTKSKAH